jgi:hypothetical protein
MYVKVRNLVLTLSSLAILALVEAAAGQVAELPIEREWGIEMAEPVLMIKMADIDEDGINEILVGTGNDSGYVYVINGVTHEVMWKSPGLVGRALSVEVGDADDDSTKEIVVGTGQGISDSGNVYIFDGLNYTLEWHKSGFDERIYSVAIGDFDMDDSTEILLGTFYDWEYEEEYGSGHGKDGNLYALDGHTYRQELRLSTDIVKKMKMVDINGDGIHETVTGEECLCFHFSYLPPYWDLIESRLTVLVRRDSVTSDGGYLFDYMGRWIEDPRAYFLDMVIGNCDSHSTKEIICSYFVNNWPSYDRRVAGLKVFDGISLDSKWSRADTSSMSSTRHVITGLALRDLNKDGINDIVAAYSDGYISVIDGITAADSAVSPQTISISSFAFGNVDDDEESEACIGGRDSLILLEVRPFTPVENKNQGYPNIPLIYHLAQNCPNPFNPTTEIKYALPKDCHVSLEIHNILGQKVATLIDGQQKAGYKTTRWDASSFSSGIYFYRLQAGDFVQTRKMVLIR